jgi:hypothetical protein
MCGQGGVPEDCVKYRSWYMAQLTYSSLSVMYVMKVVIKLSPLKKHYVSGTGSMPVFRLAPSKNSCYYMIMYTVI